MKLHFIDVPRKTNMATHLQPCVPLPIDEKELSNLVENAKDYLLLHGIGLRRRDAFDRDALHFAPFMLLPSTFPRSEFDRSVHLQPVLNELMHRVAHDKIFLTETLQKTIAVDDFTNRLFQIYETVWREGITQKVSLGMLRSDIMEGTHSCSNSTSAHYCCTKQVEINTIASGFGWLGPASGMIHRYVLSEMGHKDLLENMPENRALQGLAGAMLEAWKLYNEPKSVIMFIVEDVTYNICDQRFHEFEIRKQNPDVFVIRKTLTEVNDQGHLDEKKRLFVDGKEVSVIYFRCGYHPDQYPSNKEWDARLMIERSLAIKSPSIHYHLAGTKKVQQELAKPGVLEKFLTDSEQVSTVRSIFTGLYSMDQGEEGDKAFKMAMANPERFVVKPQREGGGNNIYGKDIPAFLESIQDSDERNAYILMERILPPISTNYMVRPGQEVRMVDCVSELGIFGSIIGTASEIYHNNYVGHMLRTKLSNVNEGGVAAGLGALDSVYLADLERCCKNIC